jgi:hypothetical protein
MAAANEQATIHLAVHRGKMLGSGVGTKLWSREWPGRRIPSDGEEVTLYPEDGDAFDGPSAAVKRRWWAFDGTVMIDLVDFHLDPPPEIERSCRGDYRRAWWTEDGDLEAQLAAAGWAQR